MQLKGHKGSTRREHGFHMHEDLDQKQRYCKAAEALTVLTRGKQGAQVRDEADEA